jgi:hypothetical protein
LFLVSHLEELITPLNSIYIYIQPSTCMKCIAGQYDYIFVMHVTNHSMKILLRKLSSNTNYIYLQDNIKYKQKLLNK